MEFIAGLKEAFIGQIGAVLKVAEVRAASLSEMEVSIKAMLYEVGGEVLRQALEALVSAPPHPPQMPLRGPATAFAP